MALKVRWSRRAEVRYENIVLYLIKKFSVNDANRFAEKTNSFLKVISEQPYAFPASKLSEVRKAVISKQTSVIYLVKDPYIYLLSFWDNRMDPVKSKY